ncbi:MAG TPA: DinB family protein [Candidatus Limnocylindrales bacterium]|nr:DinB family protein [Candidatus Acidoferrum sp.]HTS11355.1 DinB family protein [Candidatus Limnocylindrales bacterium]
MNVDDFHLLYEYNSWANRRTLDACSTLTPEQFTRDLGSSFPSIRDTLAHVCEVEWLWLERWLGRSGSLRPGSDFPTFDSLRRRWQEVESSLVGYVSALKPEDIQRVVEHKTTQGVPQAAPLWQMMQHLVNHGTYHRGQIAAMLRQLGSKATSTDLIFFYRERAAKASA